MRMQWGVLAAGALAVACGAGIEPEPEPWAEQAQGVNEPCGPVTCTEPRTWCCNASCGLCAPRGGTCTQMVCETPEQLQQAQAEHAWNSKEPRCTPPCREGYYCCNGLTNTCVPEGYMCTQGQPVRDRCGDQPGRWYAARDPAQCAVLRFYCEPGWQPFFNDCGCGCEQVR